MSFNDYEETLGVAAYTAHRKARDKREKWNDNSWGVKEAWVKAALAVRDLLDEEHKGENTPADKGDGGYPDPIIATQIQVPHPEIRSDERDETSTG